MPQMIERRPHATTALSFAGVVTAKESIAGAGAEDKEMEVARNLQEGDGARWSLTREIDGVLHRKEGSPWIVIGDAPVSMKRRRHISIERQRRVQMNTLLESLQALLPDPTPRKDRCTLLMDVINYLQSLEKKIEDLATCKREIMSSLTQAKTIVKPNKVATLSMPLHQVPLKNFHVHVFKLHKPMSGIEEIVLTFMSPCIKGLFSQILMLFNIHQIKVINATISSTSDNQLLHYFHAQVPKELNIEGHHLKALFSSGKLALSEEHIP